MVKLSSRQTTHEQWLLETRQEPSIVASEPLSDDEPESIDAAREDSMYFSCEEEKPVGLPSLDDILRNLEPQPSSDAAVPEASDDEQQLKQQEEDEEYEPTPPVSSDEDPDFVAEDSNSDEDFVIDCRRRATVLGTASARRTMMPLAVDNDSDADGEVFAPAKNRRNTHNGFLSPTSAVKLNRTARWMPPTLFEDSEDVKLRERVDRSPRKQRSLAMTPKIVKKAPAAAAASLLESSDDIDSITLDLQGLTVGDEHLIDFVPNKSRRPPKITKRAASSSIFDLTDSESEIEPESMGRVTSKTPLKAHTPAKTPRGRPKGKTPAPRTVERLRRKDFEANRDQFAKDYLKLLDDTVNDGAVARLTANCGGLQLVWTNAKQTTAGTCLVQRVYRESLDSWLLQSCVITLEKKVCDDFDRVKETLAHEYTHACVDVLDFSPQPVKGEGPHGRCFKKWAKKVGEAMGIPIPDTCHNMTINYKFEYQCPGCDRIYRAHSRKKEWLTKRGCETCKRPLVQIKPVPRTAKKDGAAAGAGAGGLTAYQKFQKEAFAKLKAELPPGTPFKLGEMQKEVTKMWKAQKARTEAGGVSDLQTKLKAAAQGGDAAEPIVIGGEDDGEELEGNEDVYVRLENLVITLDD
ncbi:hypothetical protein TWF696_006247 [Orbilia brochopaga]|uniref:SprT-like domain-containing protein n=1 Tax=Orbilia brochopaga TaxID=3140254 RepID=A0AAV9UVM7_9PEZI